MSSNFQKRLERKENQTKYRKMTRKPLSHVRILIYRTWAIRRLDEPYQWPKRCVRGAAATQAMRSRENGTTLFHWNSVFNRIDTIHLRFGLNFDCCLAKWDWKRKFYEVGHQQHHLLLSSVLEKHGRRVDDLTWTVIGEWRNNRRI